MKASIQFIIYAKEPPKKFTGILGDIDLHVIHLFLIAGSQGITEMLEPKEALSYYTNFLQEQDMTIKSSRSEIVNGQRRIWIEVDSEKTPISEYTQWNQCTPKDTDVLAWKPFWYSCTSGTTKECLGLAVAANEQFLFLGKSSLSYQAAFSIILQQ